MKRIKLMRCNVPCHCVSNNPFDIIRWIDVDDYKTLIAAHKDKKQCDITLYLQDAKISPEIWHNLDTSQFVTIVEMSN